MTTTSPPLNITLLGAGTIGLSFAAFHLTHLPHPSHLTIYDTRPNLPSYLSSTLPKFFPNPSSLPQISSITLTNTLEEAVASAHIIQESLSEDPDLKKKIWHSVEKYARGDALLWSSTSGIPASLQSACMRDKSRLLVVHPYNPPHIMPLLEVVGSPSTSEDVIRRTEDFWRARGRVPIRIRKETTGFVANRLAFALLREAIHLVDTEVVSVAELDAIVESSMGPRWAVAGPFKSYAAGGGEKGLEGFFENIGGTVQGCWDDAGRVDVGGGWEEGVFRQAREAYGVADVGERGRLTRRVLDVLEEERGKTTLER